MVIYSKGEKMRIGLFRSPPEPYLRGRGVFVFIPYPVPLTYADPYGL